MGDYFIYLNESLIITGIWYNTTPFTITINDLNQLGNCILNITIRDPYGNLAFDILEIQVEAEEIPPVIDLSLPLIIGLISCIGAAAAVGLYIVTLKRPS
jgi:hypothetical protein